MTTTRSILNDWNKTRSVQFLNFIDNKNNFNNTNSITSFNQLICFIKILNHIKK